MNRSLAERGHLARFGHGPAPGVMDAPEAAETAARQCRFMERKHLQNPDVNRGHEPGRGRSAGILPASATAQSQGQWMRPKRPRSRKAPMRRAGRANAGSWKASLFHETRIGTMNRRLPHGFLRAPRMEEHPLIRGEPWSLIRGIRFMERVSGGRPA